jgi:hypothetical protein
VNPSQGRTVIPRVAVQRWIDALSQPASDVPWGDIPADWFAARHLCYLRALGATGPDDDHPDAWTWYAFDELTRTDSDLCLDLVLAVLTLCDRPSDVAVLAAGPLEDVISGNGARIIDRIEDLSRRVPRFRLALCAVWPQGKETTDVWHRVQAARSAGASFQLDAERLPGMS